jgi:hypothetical protein
MKALLTLGLIVAAAVSAQASAATYYGSCQTCTGGATGSSWLNKAASVGAANSAAIGDTIALCKNQTSGIALVASYEVVDAPVINASDVVWIFQFGYVDVDCAGLGFP